MSYGWEETNQCDITNCTALGFPDSETYIQRTDAELMKCGVAGFTVLAASGDNGVEPNRACTEVYQVFILFYFILFYFVFFFFLFFFYFFFYFFFFLFSTFPYISLPSLILRSTLPLLSMSPPSELLPLSRATRPPPLALMPLPFALRGFYYYYIIIIIIYF